jgi:hypothetical protein
MDGGTFRGDPRYADFLKRAEGLPKDDRGATDMLLSDIIQSTLPEWMFGALAEAIATAAGLKTANVLDQLQDGREALEAEAVLGAAGVPGLEQVPHVMGKLAAGKYLNRLLGHTAHWGGPAGPPTYFFRNRDGGVFPIKTRDLHDMLANKFVRGRDADNKPARIPAAKWWTTWQDRHEVEQVAYDPERVLERNGARIENLWRDFPIQPAKGSWKRIRRHLLKVICGGNRKCFDYLLKWLAFLVQHPGKAAEVVVVVRSTYEGVGKSSLARAMKLWLGDHHLNVHSATAVFGEFNDILVGKSSLALEEAVFPGDHRMTAAFKNTITGEEVLINPKGLARFRIANMLHVMMFTNEQWAIPAGADARRFFMLDVKAKPPPRAYFEALHAEIENGGAAAMLHNLLAMKLGSFHPRNVPITQALVQQQRLSVDPITGWAHACVVAGTITGFDGGSGFAPFLSSGGFGEAHSTQQLYKWFLAWTVSQGIRHPPNMIEFGRALRSLGMTPDPAHSSGRGWQVPDAATLLAKAEARAGIQAPTV